ncbi:hypothetical protein M91_03724 [Bos mutus]|uniref:RRM domain-containing protein n=1 Tax=Bos mutus TaxID=72004 RepID=L8IVW3_9CETA|nr:hypothetical protein M91_03724 [Bos mutus]
MGQALKIKNTKQKILCPLPMDKHFQEKEPKRTDLTVTFREQKPRTSEKIQLTPDLEPSGALTVDCLDGCNGETWDIGECVPMVRHSIFAGKAKGLGIPWRRTGTLGGQNHGLQCPGPYPTTGVQLPSGSDLGFQANDTARELDDGVVLTLVTENDARLKITVWGGSSSGVCGRSGLRAGAVAPSCARDRWGGRGGGPGGRRGLRNGLESEELEPEELLLEPEPEEEPPRPRARLGAPGPGPGSGAPGNQEAEEESGLVEGDPGDGAIEDPELEAIKARVREMEEEAEKLKELQNEVEKQMNMSPPPGNAGPVIMSIEEKMEADARSIYVGNVDYGATAEELEAHFHGCGSVNRVTILCDKFSGHPKGFWPDIKGLIRVTFYILEKTWFMGCQFQTSGVFTKFLSVALDLSFQTLRHIISMEKAI